MSGLHTRTVTELSDLLARGECSSRDIVRDLIAAIDRHDPVIRAYTHLDRENALAQAATADHARATGTAGPLTGVPIAMKDILNVRGQPCTCGSRILAGYTAPYDATVVARLRAQGMVFAGRLNMDQFGMGSTTENSCHAPTRNPWNTDLVPGGSSGGSAAAVAADLAIVSLGSDTGGSIRQPASFCGCVGLKPSYGRVSRYGLTAYASSLDQVGVVSKTVADAAVMLQHIAGHDARDSTSLNEAVPDYSAALQPDLKGMRLGLPREFFGEGIDPEVAELVRAAADRCAALGATLVETSMPHLSASIAVYYILATAEASANLARFDGIRYGARVDGADPIDLYGRTRDAGFGREVKRRIILGTYVLSSGYYDAYYLKAQKARTLIRRELDHAFASCDALITPVAPTPAFPFGRADADPLQLYLGDICTVPVNLAGACGISVPAGFTRAGLPVGMQVIAPPLREDLLIRVGHAHELAADLRGRRPMLKEASA